MAIVWRVEFDRDAARDLKKLGADAQRTVLRYLRERIGDFRIVAAIEDARFVVLVVTVGHQREVYR
jgi:mRNA interferase RelE/StbE